MILLDAKIAARENITASTWLLTFFAPSIAAKARPGQFINVKVSNSSFPLLRRPFSICSVDEPFVTIMFDTVGEGTRMLAEAQTGSRLNILGPLGNGFNPAGDYHTAVLVAGGIGCAPFPFLTGSIPEEKEVITIIGARTAGQIITWGVRNAKTATDDGSAGFKGNAVQLLAATLPSIPHTVHVFGCGPNPMLRALAAFCAEKKLPCQVSVESAMACGFGICQGCPIEKIDGSGYALICKDGPVFNAAEVIL